MPDPPLKSIRACIFDLDGLLINSEDLITTCINGILHKYDRPSLPWSLKARLQGRTAAVANEIFQEWAKLPISREEYQRQLAGMHQRVFVTTELLPGVKDLLWNLRRNHAVELALATSSTREKFLLKTHHLRDILDPCFQPDCRVLGDDPRVKKHKPEPDCYLLALECVNAQKTRMGETTIERDECLVFEDALQGVEAGRQAGMQVVWCPHQGLLHELCEGDDSAARFMFGRLFELGDGSVVLGMNKTELAACVQQATQGRVRLMHSLEKFPYNDYGIHVC